MVKWLDTVGTKMGVSADSPYFDMAYKMVHYAGRPALKLSPGKETLVSKKQVFRFTTGKGKLKKDIIGLRDERLKESEPLLEKVMNEGKITAKWPSLTEIQKRFLTEFIFLDDEYKSIEGSGKVYPVRLSQRLKRLESQVIQRVRAENSQERLEG